MELDKNLTEVKEKLAEARAAMKEIQAKMAGGEKEVREGRATGNVSFTCS